MNIYPKHPDADAYALNGGTVYTPYAYVARDKRFTDAELAAEFHKARLVSRVRHARTENYPGDKHLFDHYEKGLEEEWIIERFATLPHFDQEGA